MSSKQIGTAKLSFEDKEYELPLVEGTEGERAIDIRRLRADTGMVTLDPAYGNTGSCESGITFINGEKGILHYRGYPIEEVATRARFTEVCYLLIFGKRPTIEELSAFRHQLTYHTLIHEDMKKFFEGFPRNGHPMAIMAAMFVSLSAYYPDESDITLNIIRALAKAKTIAAFSYKKSIGQPFVYPRNDLSWPANFLRMMFAVPSEEYEVDPVFEDAFNLLLILHADHEQNCSTSTMRMVGSSESNLFASLSAAICALWGPRHGGANQAVIEMLHRIQADGGDYKRFLDQVKDKDSNVKLMGFGHRVYKNFDPRARLLKQTADRIFDKLGINDPLLELAKKLEEVALNDEFFVSRRLYPNVDFYSGIIYRAMGIPTEIFTVMFILGRLPGWIAHWMEMRDEGNYRIHRPRQVYTGEIDQTFEDRNTKNM
ncbi:MAG: citrate (Si)-synthase [Proteobacteria bacterium]|nr:MAG: citrate (Si)-synthase [Pseudomonadota bacterium]PIE19763.1 MAG: citrate (Si)-synthase [Pseudomonadota bacterium]